MDLEGTGAEHRAVEAAEAAASVMTAAGMPRMPARVMMALVAAPAGGYTAAEIADRLGVSAAAVSGAAKYLQQLRFVQRNTRPGERLQRYTLEPETFYASVASNAPVYERMAVMVDHIAAAHADDARARAQAAELADFFRFMAARFPGLIDEWAHHRGRAAPEPDVASD